MSKSSEWSEPEPVKPVGMMAEFGLASENKSFKENAAYSELFDFDAKQKP